MSTIMKCLRALSLPLAAEHSMRDDILMAAPEELLSIPAHACNEENNPHCQCRRVFVGIHTGQPTTLARVSLAEPDTLRSESDSSPRVVPYSVSSADFDGVVLHGMDCVANALRHFEPGTLLRINRTATAVYLEDTWKSALQRMGAVR